MTKVSSATLPANNISQQLFYKQLPDCDNRFGQPDFKPAPCCGRDLSLGLWYKKAPTNLWNTASNYQGGPGFSSCTDDAFTKQCFLSQYFNYLSKNNELSS
jgi:hypothetical protein